jgi:outer membrane protein insertion porin family
VIVNGLPQSRVLKKATALAAAFFGVMAIGAAAQQPDPQQAPSPVRVDSVVVEGNERVVTQAIASTFAVQPGQEITYREVQRGIKALLATNQFSDIVVTARGTDPYVLVVHVEERPIVRRISITGLEHVSVREVRDTTQLNTGLPLNRQRILDAKAFIRAELADDGIPFAQIDDRVVPVEGESNEVDILLDVAEGQRVTVAQVGFVGNERVPAGDLRGVMSIKPEGFFWFRSGSFDEMDYTLDLEQNLPALYRSRGFLDFEVVADTVIVDPSTGKARLEVTVDEGPQYRLESFTINGNARFPTEQLESYFATSEGGLLASLGIGGGGGGNAEGQVFDAESFNAAIASVMELYRNEGYLYAQVNPVVQRIESDNGGPPMVAASWEITEREPAIVNRVSVGGNDYTHEWVIRNQISILPGDVYSQQRVLRSYQSISSLGFFEAPMPFPDIQPLENGDVDITFNVVEKQTGTINFGTSVGGGVGLSGFIGYEQPNLFGQAKAGTLRWDFGRYLNSFEVSYTDPALLKSMVSGSISLFNSRDRFFQFTSGRRRRIGGNLRFGFPWQSSRVTRVFVGYGLSRTEYELFTNEDDNSLFGRPPGVQSQLSVGMTRQTLDHPLFPTIGSRQNINVETNGGFLGGDGEFTRVLTDGSWWVPVGRLGGSETGGGIRFALGLTLRGGAVFGDAGAFPFDRFWMGGVQFGQNLRGYEETTITPLGHFPQSPSAGITDIERLGNAFFSMTAEYALRLSDQISMSLFYDAGNVWRNPAEFDPTRLFRGAGFGFQLVTPFGPLGLDYAYGFDKTAIGDAGQLRPAPGWQLHFRMGPGF